MATVIREETRGDAIILVYDNGMERNKVTGHMVKPAPNTVLTAERASLLHRQRREKAARLLRDAIRAETMDKLDVPHTGTAAAVAAAGGILWREIVLEESAYPRDRLDAWEKLGKYAQVLPSDIRQQQPDDSAQLQALTAAANAATAQTLERLWRDVAQARGEVVDAEEHNDG